MTETTKKHKMFPNGTHLSVTLNGDDSIQCFNDNMENRLWNTYIFYNNYLHKMFKPWCEYEFQLEISRKGRIHMHGTVKMIDYERFYLLYSRKIDKCEYINAEIDTIETYSVWQIYCSKDSLLMIPLCKKSRGVKQSITHDTPCASIKELVTKYDKQQKTLTSYFESI